jgi:mono/diheme cytochrome c family protein
MSKKHWIHLLICSLAWGINAQVHAAHSKTTTLTLTQISQAEALYQQHCQQCHGENRLGGMGPALFPENLSRLKKSEAIETITQGRVATQMPAFNAKLSAEQIQLVTDFIYSSPKQSPHWTVDDIKQSHHQFIDPTTLANTPIFSADPMNLFVVVELGDHAVSVLDGDTFTVLKRFKTHYALHGGPKYSPDGRFVYFASRDGWISKYDLYNFKTIAEIRVGINTRNLAVSSDGRYAIASNYLPHNIVILDTKDLSPLHVITADDQQGNSSRVSAVYNAPPRKSFIIALKDIKQLWEIPYSTLASQQPTVRRIPTDDFLDDFFFDQHYQHVIAASRRTMSGHVIELDSGKKVADIAVNGMPHLGSGITWQYQGHTVMATPNIAKGLVSIIDMTNWQVIKEIKTDGPGFFMRSHQNSPYAWVDVFFGPHKDEMHVIDKKTLTITKTLKPQAGKTAAHVEFTRDGRFALVSIWENDGALVIYDANSLQEIKRIPMKKPSGKYNVYNKTHYEQGTSH